VKRIFEEDSRKKARKGVRRGEEVFSSALEG